MTGSELVLTDLECRAVESGVKANSLHAVVRGDGAF